MKRISSILIVALLVVMIGPSANFVSAQTTPSPVIRVGWNVIDQTQNISHTEQSSEWMFGAQPSIVIQYADNGTDIAENHYSVRVNEELFINITIPKSFLGDDVGLDTLMFWGAAGTTEKAQFILVYNVTSDMWATPVTLHYAPGAQTPTAANFMTSDVANNSYVETADYYRVIFAVTFVQAIMHDIFWTGMQAIDTLGRPVSPSWLSRLQTGIFITPPIGLGVAINPRDYSLPQYFYGDIVSPDGNMMHYATYNDTFIVEIKSAFRLGNVSVPFAIITWDPQYQQWINYTQPVGFPNQNMYVEHPAMENVSAKIGPMIYFVHNATGTYALAGYPHIEFKWAELAPGTNAWLPEFTMIHNTTIDLSKYYVLNKTYTGEFNGGTGVRWGGYFTNNTDMDQSPFSTGDVIDPGDILYFTQVEDIKGHQLAPAPEISAKSTMKLAYRADFIEAGVYDAEGNLANRIVQGETVNLTMLIHKPLQTLNGTSVYNSQGNLLQVNERLANASLQLSGSGYGENDTYTWRTAATYNITLDFEHNTTGVWSVSLKQTYFKANGTAVGPVETHFDWIDGYLITVNDFNLTLGPNLSKLYVNFTFDAQAPDMTFEKATMTIGQVENIAIWDGANFVVPGEVVPYWVNQYKHYDVSNDIIWRPPHVTLGNVQVYVPQTWAVTDSGAIDLDGNTYTTNDQYYVKATSYWSDWGNITAEGMNVNIVFDPTPGQPGDEFRADNWMGAIKMVLDFNANQTFYWYHASDMSPVSDSEMNQIRAELWADMGNNLPQPQYSMVAWLSRNWTIDMTQIPGLESGSWSNTWFAWGSQQWFAVAVSQSSATLATFRTEYAGMLIYHDDPTGASADAPDFAIQDGTVVTNEVTHVVLIDDIGSIEIRQPFGATNGTGLVNVSPGTDINFGVTINNVSVTIYPLQRQNGDGMRSPWDLRQSPEGALGLNSTNFDYSVSHATISEMSFDVSFGVDVKEYNASDPTTWNHAASFKVDQTIGDWNMQGYDNSVLVNRSLAVNYFAVLATATRTQYQAGSQPVTDTNGNSIGANYYVFGSADSPYANVSMGGLPYTWAGDDPAYSVQYMSGSSTAPIGAFSLMYQSSSGQSITQWNVDASMLFMTAGYTHWGGQEIRVDPVFVSYTNAQQTLPPQSTTTTTPPTSTTGPTSTPVIPNGGPIDPTLLMVAGLVIVAVMVCVLVRRRR